MGFFKKISPYTVWKQTVISLFAYFDNHLILIRFPFNWTSASDPGSALFFLSMNFGIRFDTGCNVFRSALPAVIPKIWQRIGGWDGYPFHPDLPVTANASETRFWEAIFSVSVSSWSACDRKCCKEHREAQSFLSFLCVQGSWKYLTQSRKEHREVSFCLFSVISVPLCGIMNKYHTERAPFTVKIIMVMTIKLKIFRHPL